MSYLDKQQSAPLIVCFTACLTSLRIETNKRLKHKQTTPENSGHCLDCLP